MPSIPTLPSIAVFHSEWSVAHYPQQLPATGASNLPLTALDVSCRPVVLRSARQQTSLYLLKND